jgi:hypothetical protein
VSLIEIDKETGMYVGKFKLALIRKHGDMLTAWFKGIDTNKSCKIDEAEIAACVKNLGLDLDPAKLFRMLCSGPTPKGLTLAEFDPEAWVRYITGDFLGLARGKDTEFLEDLEELGMSTEMPETSDALRSSLNSSVRGVQKLRKAIMDKEKAELKAEHDAITKNKAGLHTVDGFKKALVDRCGSLFGAWRVSLDLDGNGRLTFGEFCQALHRLGLFGDVKGLWKKLKPPDKDYLLFSDLDPKTDAMMKGLSEKCTESTATC